MSIVAELTDDRLRRLTVGGLRNMRGRLEKLAGDVERIVGWPALAASLQADYARVVAELRRRGVKV
jgi:hypothetical protein